MNKTLPVKHLSARVPWHDNKWNGKTCCSVLDNSFCRILPKIDSTKQPDSEPSDKEITVDFFSALYFGKRNIPFTSKLCKRDSTLMD